MKKSVVLFSEQSLKWRLRLIGLVSVDINSIKASNGFY